MAGRARRLAPLTVLFLSAFMALLDVTVVTVAVPDIGSDLNAGLPAQQWVITSYTLIFSAFLLTGGTLGDRYGRRRVLLTSVVAFAVASALCGLAPSPGLLIAARALQGLAAAAMLPGTLSMIAWIFPDPRERARAIGMWSGVAGLALIAGPVLGGWLVGSYGWSSVFFLNLPVAAVVLAVAPRVLPAVGSGRERLDLPGQLAAVVGTGGLAFALIQGDAEGWTSPVIMGGFAAGAAGLIALVIAETRVPDPMLPLALFRQRPFLIGNLVSFLLGFGLFSMFFFLSLYMQQVRGESALHTGLAFLPGSVAIVLAAPLSGVLATRLGHRVPMGLGLAVAGISLLTMHRLTVDAGYGRWWWCVVLMGLGIGLALSPTTALVLSAVPRERSGTGSSIANAHRQFGIVFGVAVLGALLTQRFTSLMGSTPAGAGLSSAERERVADAFLHEGGGAARAPGPPETAERLAAAAKDAFVEGLHDVLTTGAVVLLAGAVITVALPARRRGEAGSEAGEVPHGVTA
ncbi:MFS transporter [Actinomadura soli]|uniref:MFS transporter n=1 Tax=Actinomadura soli TaxID=2508997 RepID=A0A5C4J9N9_9ACTN|nr:MFS transporter [Actinomadura soli]TMQ97407.1 MFS transporter [Actinomadura soli]